jgi:hypothetical protein
MLSVTGSDHGSVTFLSEWGAEPGSQADCRSMARRARRSPGSALIKLSAYGDLIIRSGRASWGGWVPARAGEPSQPGCLLDEKND